MVTLQECGVSRQAQYHGRVICYRCSCGEQPNAGRFANSQTPGASRLLAVSNVSWLAVSVTRNRQSHLQPLKRQLIKSALSTSSNLAEGRTKHSEKEFLRFLQISLGSSGELQYQLQAAIDCNAINRDEGTALAKRAEEVAKMTQGLIRRIRRDLNNEGPSANS
jgi:four helix bundle protein